MPTVIPILWNARTAKDLNGLVELGKKRGYKRPFLWAQWVIRARKQKQEMK